MASGHKYQHEPVNPPQKWGSEERRFAYVIEKLFDELYNKLGKIKEAIDSGGIKGDKGDKGDTGEKGDKGDTGTTGAAGRDGVIANIGADEYSFNINSSGHLILTYSGGTAPNFAIDANGHLIHSW